MAWVHIKHIPLVHRTPPDPLYVTKRTPRTGPETFGMGSSNSGWILMASWKVAGTLSSFHLVDSTYIAADLGQRSRV